MRRVAAGHFVILGLGTAVALFTQRRGKATVDLALAFGALIIWWGTIGPPAEADWAPDVARQTTGTLNGDILTLSDVRDFEWTSASDFASDGASAPTIYPSLRHSISF